MPSPRPWLNTPPATYGVTRGRPKWTTLRIHGQSCGVEGSSERGHALRVEGCRVRKRGSADLRLEEGSY